MAREGTARDSEQPWLSHWGLGRTSGGGQQAPRLVSGRTDGHGRAGAREGGGGDGDE